VFDVGTSADYIPLMPHGALKDSELIRRMAHGETTALRELYVRHGRLVYGLAWRILLDGESAEEVCQDVFLRVWEKADTYRSEKAQVRTWLARVARNRAIDMLRRRGVHKEHEHDAWEEVMKMATEAQPNPSAPMEAEEQRKRLSYAILSLPLEQRDALSRAFFQGQTHREIAAATGEPLGTIKSRIRTAMVRLREVLKDQSG
jgi:RNA polymerase sigma-70 factor (ECF subfamily)